MLAIPGQRELREGVGYTWVEGAVREGVAYTWAEGA